MGGGTRACCRERGYCKLKWHLTARALGTPAKKQLATQALIATAVNGALTSGGPLLAWRRKDALPWQGLQRVGRGGGAASAATQSGRRQRQRARSGAAPGRRAPLLPHAAAAPPHTLARANSAEPAAQRPRPVRQEGESARSTRFSPRGSRRAGWRSSSIHHAAPGRQARCAGAEAGALASPSQGLANDPGFGWAPSKLPGVAVVLRHAVAGLLGRGVAPSPPISAAAPPRSPRAPTTPCPRAARSTRCHWSSRRM